MQIWPLGKILIVFGWMPSCLMDHYFCTKQNLRPTSTIIPVVEDCNLEYVNNIAPTDYLAVPDSMPLYSQIRFLCSTSVALQFLYKCRRKVIYECAAMKDAERLLIRHAQNESFYSVISAIKYGAYVHASICLLFTTNFTT